MCVVAINNAEIQMVQRLNSAEINGGGPSCIFLEVQVHQRAVLYASWITGSLLQSSKLMFEVSCWFSYSG